MTEVPDINEENYKLKIIGKSGLFKTRCNAAVEYIQSSLKISQLKSIEPVRKKFEKGELNFELMLQRDLDDERVKKELIPYLKREKQLSFFPPILVVILEIVKETNTAGRKITKIKEFYPQIEVEKNFKQGSALYYKRDYGDLFNIKIFKKNGELQRWLTELNVGPEATLLAIDGQHRLVSLQAIAGLLEKDDAALYGDADTFKDEFKDMEVPITFIFIPDSYKDSTSKIALTKTFRQVFVDVNKHARKVTKMRNILLEENDIRSIYTRMVCSFLRNKTLSNDTDSSIPIDEKFITIDEIEWDKVNQEFQLTSQIAFSNLLFINSFFEKWLNTKGEGMSLKVNLKLDDYKKELEDDDCSYDNLTVKDFTFRQKEVLMSVFQERFLEGFAHLLSSIPFALDWSQRVKNLKMDLEKRIEKDDPEKKLCIKARSYLFGGREYKNLLKSKEFGKALKEFVSRKTDEFLKETGDDIFFIRTNMFQVAYLRLMTELYAGSSINNFSEFSRKVKRITNSQPFKDKWQEIFLENRKDFEMGIKGTKGYSTSKEGLMYNYLEIFFKNNQSIFKDLAIEFDELATDVEKVRKEFLDNLNSRIEGLELEPPKDIRESFNSFLEKVYLL